MRKTQKRTLMLSAMVTALFLLFAGTAVYAAGVLEERVEVKVPFDFMVEDDALPAGTYMIYAADEDKPEVMRIESKDGEHNLAFLTKPISAPVSGVAAGDDSKVVFHERKGEHFLSEVWIPQHSNGRLVIPSDTEKKMAKQGHDATRRVISGEPDEAHESSR